VEKLNRKNYSKMKEGVVAIIQYQGENENYKGKILIGKKRSDSPKFFAGMWHIPGETKNEDEDDSSALIRGAKEEVSLNIIPGKFLGSSISFPNSYHLNWYECLTKDHVLDYTGGYSDLEDAKWVDRKKVLEECNSKITCFWPEWVSQYFQD